MHCIQTCVKSILWRNVFSIYFSKALYFLGKTEFDVDSFSYTQNLTLLATTLLLTVLGGKLKFCEALSMYGEESENIFESQGSSAVGMSILQWE